ncbi:hypothetical protein HK103_001475 [Boothiomyces macroporosus]|uniref:Uncharacterized protein n=1 Tax=Boothiomyces macroporosus TaxID=261099 RepID=A0AAD5Y9V5_9FUNG|nr:hypothetical protein HK103_001475 [Boothiomyces macroporosus]
MSFQIVQIQQVSSGLCLGVDQPTAFLNTPTMVYAACPEATFYNLTTTNNVNYNISPIGKPTSCVDTFEHIVTAEVITSNPDKNPFFNACPSFFWQLTESNGVYNIFAIDENTDLPICLDSKDAKIGGPAYVFNCNSTSTSTSPTLNFKITTIATA